MTAQYLADSSAIQRILGRRPEALKWEGAVTAGLVAVCPVVELEVFRSARNLEDRRRYIGTFRTLFGYAVMDDRTFDRALEVQELLTARGWHRSAGPIDLQIAATAELQGMTLLHEDKDFERVRDITGQPMKRMAGDTA